MQSLKKSLEYSYTTKSRNLKARTTFSNGFLCTIEFFLIQVSHGIVYRGAHEKNFKMALEFFPRAALYALACLKKNKKKILTNYSNQR